MDRQNLPPVCDAPYEIGLTLLAKIGGGGGGGLSGPGG